jgi:hypothetical protein|nr:MAG TPA_asm: endonuclease [Caudoviricetes sp.]
MDEAAEISEIRERLSYDPETGLFTWVKSARSGFVGRRAGCFDAITGYIRIAIAGKVRYAHRVAWAYVYGRWPDKEIDHINCDRTDNRLANLRLADCIANSWNRQRTGKNLSGFKGVSFNSRRGTWRAGIKAHGKSYNLGDYSTREDAHAAYVAAAERLHGDFARVA